MHGVDQTQTLLDSALPQTVLDLGRDVDELPASGNIEPQFLSVALHKVYVLRSFLKLCTPRVGLDQPDIGQAI